MAYSDYTQLMDLTEKMISEMVKNLTGSYELTISKQGTPVTVNFQPPFRRISMIETLERVECCITRKNVEFKSKSCRMLDKLVHFIEDNKNYWGTPYFICDHPSIHSRISRHRTLQCVYRIK